MRHLHLVGKPCRVIDMTTTVCEAETCETCGAGCIDTKNGECRPCSTLAHNLRLMAAGVSRDKATGRYIKIGAKK